MKIQVQEQLIPVLIKGSNTIPQPILPDKKYDPMILDPRKGVYSVNAKNFIRSRYTIIYIFNRNHSWPFNYN